MTHRTLVPVLLALVLVFALGLALTKRSWAPLDLSAEADAVTLATAGEAVELPPFRVSKIEVIGDGSIEGAPGVDAFRSHIQAEAAAAPPGSNAEAQSLSLSGLTLVPNGRLKLRKLPGVDHGFELTVSGSSDAQVELQIFGQAPYEISADSDTRSVTASQASMLSLFLGSAAFTLRITLAEPQWSVARPFAISRLDFRDTASDDDPAAVFSALKTGLVRFLDIESLDGSDRRMDLQPRQMLMVGAIRDGFVRDLSIGRNSISIGVTGEVSDLKTIWKTSVRDHMPTLLATLSSSDPMRKIAVFSLGFLLALTSLLSIRGARP